MTIHSRATVVFGRQDQAPGKKERDRIMGIMLREWFLSFLAVILVSCTGSLTPVSTPSPGKLDAEEPAIYSALLQSLYSASSYVIMDTTATSPGGVEEPATTVEGIEQNMPGIDPKTVENFQIRNEAAYLLQADMQLGISFFLLSQTEMSEIFSQNRDGWQLFYEQYPDAPGITTVSRVGFNDTLDQALVYVGTMSHWLAGAGYYVLLEKVDGSWIIDQQVMTWIS